jgi:PAS domain S-box-containing protein
MAEKKMRRKKEEFGAGREDLVCFGDPVEKFISFLPLATCIVNSAEAITNTNRAFNGLTGYNSSEISAKPLNDIFSEKGEVKAMLDRIKKTGAAADQDLTLISKEKKEIHVKVFVSARRDRKNNFSGYFLAVTSISEIKKSREALEEKVKERTKELEDLKLALLNILEDVEGARKKAEEEKNKTLAVITNFTDGLVVFDKNNKLSLINTRAEYFFGVKSAEVFEKTFPEIYRLPSMSFLSGILEGGDEGVFRKEISLKEDLILEASKVPITRDKERVGILVVLHDITREKRVERMKSEFVSISAHQLRTPLAAIKWTLRMILDGDAGSVNQEQKELLNKTYLSNERMIFLINDLLDVTRIEEGRDLYKPILADIESVIQFVVNSYKEETQRRKIKLEFKKPASGAPKVLLDVEKMRLAIQNLLDNAIKYSLAGGEVTVSLRYDKKEIEVAVRDTGVGIPQYQRERIFTKFFRGSNVIKMETDGSGLGLFIVKNIIEAHGGRIWFASEENKGTTFYFTIPVREEFEEFLKDF